MIGTRELVLTALADYSEGCTLRALVSTTGLHPQTLERLLWKLQQEGHVIQTRKRLQHMGAPVRVFHLVTNQHSSSD